MVRLTKRYKHLNVFHGQFREWPGGIIAGGNSIRWLVPSFFSEEHTSLTHSPHSPPFCHSFISSMLHFVSKVATAGQRTAEAALGPQFLKRHTFPNKQVISKNRGRERERGRGGKRGQSVTEELPMPRNACQESMRDRQITVQQPCWYILLQISHARTYTLHSHPEKTEQFHDSFLFVWLAELWRAIVSV